MWQESSSKPEVLDDLIGSVHLLPPYFQNVARRNREKRGEKKGEEPSSPVRPWAATADGFASSLSDPWRVSHRAVRLRP